MREPTGTPARKGRSFGRLLPIIVLLVGLGLFFALGLDHYLSFEALRHNREWLMAQVDEYGVVAGIVFTLIYAVVVAFSIPGGAVLTITGGFLFGTWAAAVCVVVGATLGAVALFLAARTAFAECLHAKAGSALLRMEAGFQEDALSYLLVLRLIPLFPFWLVNLVPALLGVPLRTYVIGTFIGIIPGTVVFASLGSGVGSVFDSSEEFSLTALLTPELLLALGGLVALALLPVIYKKMKARRANQS